MVFIVTSFSRRCIHLHKTLNRSKSTYTKFIAPRMLRTCEVSIIDTYKDDGYDKLPVKGTLNDVNQ